MKIAIIGAGRIGSILAKGLSAHTHQIILGVRNPLANEVKLLVDSIAGLNASAISNATAQSDIIILAVPFVQVPDAARAIGNSKGKIILETTNPFGKTLDGYKNSIDAIKQITGAEDVAKCFNSIGAESLANPSFGKLAADNFVAGSSRKAKDVATELSKELGFGNCFDLGGDDALPLIETIAQLFMAMAYNTKLGRRLAFKVLH